MDSSIMTWNGNNSHDDDASYPSPHYLLLTLSLNKTGGRSSPCIVDENKTLNNDSFPPDNTIPSTAFTSPDNNNTTNLPPTAFTSPSHRPMTPCSVPTLAEMKSYVCNNIPIANNSQPNIFSTDNTAG